MTFTIRRATLEDKPGWLKLRQGLWPDAPVEYLSFDMDERLADPDYLILVACAPDHSLSAFIEAGLRDHGEGCETSPVGYIEAWYVEEHARGQNLGGQLMDAAEQWAREKGCQEMASDTWLENEPSITAHLKRGYVEVERLVHFVKRL